MPLIDIQFFVNQYYVPIGLRVVDVVVEKEFLVVVLLWEQLDDVRLQLVLHVRLQPGGAAGRKTLKKEAEKKMKKNTFD